MSHTPGPWAADINAPFKIRAPQSDRVIAYLAPDNTKENGRLVIAAPEMLELLIRLHKAFCEKFDLGADLTQADSDLITDVVVMLARQGVPLLGRHTNG